ncbi:MAG: RNA methyltransferase [Thermanaeromonas sp.]|nr:RNA methyltransferase [Thermanaeromonas sp.]
MVAEALQAKAELEVVLYNREFVGSPEHAELIEQLARAGYRCIEVPTSELNRVSATVTPPGILAIARQRKISIESLLASQEVFLLVADGVQDPGNLGTMLRTAVAAGCTGALLTTGTVDPYNEKVVRASMGALFYLPVVSGLGPGEVISRLEGRSKIIVGHVAGEIFYHECDYGGSVAIVVGNENRGPSPEILARAHARVKIPLWGPVESLNVAVAAGLLLYEAARCRHSSCT